MDREEVLAIKARRLVDRLEYVHSDSQYQAVWLCYQSRGWEYKGPQYTEELDDLKRLLEDLGW